tara:strand:+ start:281 stop:907 length:627 start_codon:yes stop_codon:yes gene_type:complete
MDSKNDRLFSMRYEPVSYSGAGEKSRYQVASETGDRWPFMAVVTLGDMVLAHSIQGIEPHESQFQFPGYDFVPQELLEVGEKILQRESVDFHFGFEKPIPLRFVPYGNDRTRISLQKETLCDEHIAFDPASVEPKIEETEYVAFQFFNFYNTLVKDALQFEGEASQEAVSRLMPDLQRVQQKESIRSLFQRNETEFAIRGRNQPSSPN